MKHTLMAIVMAGVLATTAACGSDSTDSGGEGSGDKVTSVTIGTTTPQATFAALYIASHNDLWKKYGLDVKIVTLTPATGPAALASGSVEILLDGTGTVGVAAKVPDKVILIGTLNQAFSAIWAGPEVKTLADLKDKSIGETAPSSQTDATSQRLFEDAGLAYKDDVKVQYISTSDGMIAAYTKGLIQAAVITSANIAQAGDAGMHEIVDFAKTDYAGFNRSIMGVGRSFAEDNPDVVSNVLKVLLEGQDIALHDEDTAVKAIAQYGAMPEDVAKSAYETSIERNVYKIQELDQTTMELDLSAIPDVPADTDPEKLYDNSYLEKAEGKS